MPVGSLRNIQLKRNGKVVAVFDAYDLLIRGDNSQDARLLPGDVIFVPPIGKTVSVGGAVNRPAIYEVRRLTSAADLVELAGGFTPVAYAEGAILERIDSRRERTVLAVDLAGESANGVIIEHGDRLFVPGSVAGRRECGDVVRACGSAWNVSLAAGHAIDGSDRINR